MTMERSHTARQGFEGGVRLSALVAFLLIMAATALAQNAPEEIVVGFEIPRLMSTDIFVQYDGRTIYLPIAELFRILDFNVTSDLSRRSFSGFMFNKNNRFEIDLAGSQAIVGKQKIPLAEGDYILGTHDLFLRVDMFQKLFGLPMEFDFSRMRVLLPLNKDFPAYQKLQRKQAHDKLKTAEAALHDVETLPFRRAYLKGGVADWMVSANPVGSGRIQYFNLSTGGMLLGGDFNVSGGGDTKTGIDTRQMNYKWHYFFNDNKYLTQAEVGDVFAGGAISRSLQGVLLTNKPQVHRTYFQTIELSNNIGRGWEVELYLDNRLVDFTQTDENGWYHFNLDIFYGASLVTLKMYGPNGEIRTENSHIRIPYTLVPKGEMEYTVAAGRSARYEDQKPYAQSHVYYGLTRKVTAGLSTDIPLQTTDKEEPVVVGELTVQPLQNLTVNGFYAPNHAASGAINFSQPSLVNLSAQMTRYYSNRLLNRPDTLLQSIVFSASSPLSIHGRMLGLRAYVGIDKSRHQTVINANYGFSTTLSGFHLNYLGSYKPESFERGLTSQLLVSAGMIRWLRPQIRVDYDHQANQLLKYGLYITKRLFRTGQMTFSYERNEMSKANMIMATFNIMSSFASFTSRMVTSGHEVGISQTQRGSIRYDHETNNVRCDYRNGVGFGTAVLKPFKDSNFNGKLDAGEELIPGLKAKIRGTGGQMVGQDRSIYYDRLRPYDEYMVQIDAYSLDNPLLKPAHEGYKIAFNPNIVTAIPVPIVAAGEISGQVIRKTLMSESGLGGIKIEVVNTASETVTEITTFSNGEFYYLGLVPGQYRAYVKPEQLSTYSLVSDPATIEFEMKAVETGGSVGDINFTLAPQTPAVDNPTK
jgi:hypothetical protein